MLTKLKNLWQKEKKMDMEIVKHLIYKTMYGTGDSDRHAMTLFSIALSIRAKTIIELGVRNGNTTLPLLLGAQANNGFLFSVDIENPEFICPAGLKPYWKFNKCDAIEFLNKWDKNQIVDMIYIDDWHSYDHVSKELSIIDELISPKSIILLHDLMYANWEPHYHCDMAVKEGQWANGGPYRAVAELNQNFWEFSTIPSSNGLTILRKKYSSRFHK